MMKRYYNNHHRKGAVLALVVMVVLLLSMTSLALIRVGTEARLRTVKDVSRTAARFAADAGVERALYIMNKQLEAGTWTLNEIPTYTAEPLTATNASYTVTYSGNLINGYAVTSEGRSRGQTKAVRATFDLTSPFAENFAILTRSTLIIKNNSNIYAYNSSDLSQTGLSTSIGTLSIQDDDIVIGNNGQINGDVYIGPNGDPDSVVDLGNNTDVTGEQFVMPQEYYLPAITPPDYVASQGAISGKNITLKSSDNGRYTGITIDKNGKLTIDEDVTLYVTGDIELDNNAEIEIDNDASLKLYFDGDFTTKNNTSINNLSQIPAKVMVFGTGENQVIQIKNKNDLYCAIYAPSAEMEVFNNIAIYGSFILNSIDFKNSADIYYDKALKEVSTTDEGIRFTITRWEEL